MKRSRANRSFAWLTGWLLIHVSCAVLFIALDDVFALIAFLVFIGSIVGYLIALGEMASDIGSNVALWVALTLITGSFGILVSYVLMLYKLNPDFFRARSERRES